MIYNPVTGNPEVPQDLSSKVNRDQTVPQVTVGTLPFPGFVAVATLGAELAPALTGVTGVNWTYGSGFTSPLAGSAIKTGNGSTFNAVTGTPTIGLLYKIVITISGWTTGNINVYLGGVIAKTSSGATGVISGNGTFTLYVIPTATTKLSLVLTSTSRLTIASISVKPMDLTTGVMTAQKFVKEYGFSSQFLKADGSVDSTVYMPYTWLISPDANGRDITKLANLIFATTGGGANGTKLHTIAMSGGYQGLRIYDTSTGDYADIFPRRSDGTSPSYGDVLKLNSATGGYNPAPLDPGLFELDPITGAIRIKAAYSPFEYSTQFGNNLAVVNSSEHTIGENSLFGTGMLQSSVIPLEGVTAGNAVEEIFVKATTTEKISIFPDFFFAMSFDIWLVDKDRLTNRWRFHASAKNVGGVVQGIDVIKVDGSTDKTWYTDGVGGTDIDAVSPNENSSQYLRLDTDSVNRNIRLFLSQSGTPTTDARIVGRVTIEKIYLLVETFESTYYARSFSDAMANGDYADLLSPYNGKPSFSNGTYVLRWEPSDSKWELTSTGTRIHSCDTITGTYKDSMNVDSGVIGTTNYYANYYGHSFTDTTFNGQFQSGTTFQDNEPIFTLTSNTLSYSSANARWELKDYMGSVIYHSATIEGTYLDYMESANGYIDHTGSLIPTPYFGFFFYTDGNANGFYSPTGNTVYGYPEYMNTNGYYLRYDGSQWTIQDSMSSYRYVSNVLVSATDWYVYMGGQEGLIADTTPVYAGSGFSDPNANGDYFLQGNTYNGQYVYTRTDGTCRLRYDGMYWTILDAGYMVIAYSNVGITGQYYTDTSFTTPSGTIA